MDRVDISEANVAFSDVIERVARGERLVITKHGKDIAIVSPAPKKLIGLLGETIPAPDDIKTPFKEDIEDMFYGEHE